MMKDNRMTKPNLTISSEATLAFHLGSIESETEKSHVQHIISAYIETFGYFLNMK